jgi:hypothetical protein
MAERDPRTSALGRRLRAVTLRLLSVGILTWPLLAPSASISGSQDPHGSANAADAAGGSHSRLHALRGERALYRRSGEILVEYERGASRGLTRAPGLAGTVQSARGARGDLEALAFDEDEIDFDSLRAQILASPGVRRAEPNLLLSTLEATPGRSPVLERTDLASKQWHLDRVHGQSSRTPRLRRGQPAGRAIRIGVIDTGVDYEHPELSGRTRPGVNLISHPLPGEAPDSEGDENGHGTRVAGIIAAADDENGVLGINPRAEIYSIKTFNRDGNGFLEDVIAGIDWAIRHEMDVINMSFGTYGHSEMLEDAIARAAAAGILLVAAAGNDAARIAMFPAAFDAVISVGAHDEGGWTSQYSNWGPDVDFHAPGTGILTTDLWNGDGAAYTTFNGTSAAAAYVSGLGSLLVESDESAGSARAILNESVIVRHSPYHLRPEGDRWLNGRLVMARLLREPYANLTVAAFDVDRSIFAHEDEVPITVQLQSTGTRPSTPTPMWLVVREGEAERRLPLGQVPSLLPGQRHEARSTHIASELLRANAGAATRAHRLSIEVDLEQFPQAPRAQRRLVVSEEPLNGVRIRALWASPLKFGDPHAERTLYATLENTGRVHQGGLSARAYAVAALHEGVGRAPKTALGTVEIGSLMSGETTQLSLSLADFEPPAHRVTFWLEVDQYGEPLTRSLQGYRYANAGDTASPEYAQNVHRAIADQAVELLEAQGIQIPDLHDPGSIYRGSPAVFNSWPTTTGLPTAAWSDPDYWTDANLAALAATYSLGTFTLVDGSHDADGIDIAFGYTFEDNFDSHFWIVDNFDDDGLDSSGINHHSALSKLRALLFGTGPGPLADSQLAYGAIDHYAAGHKQAAWWFVGHAVHLIGDLSVPSHVDNENAHGVFGATYHDWMDSGNYLLWDYTDALSRGGLIEPFDVAAEGDPIRYLAYTTAQLGNSFPWAETIGTQGGAHGNRTAGGDLPHYDGSMSALFSTLYFRPLLQYHVNKNEVRDFFFGCQLVDIIGFESPEDCWDNDGHIDFDNTDSGGSNNDGDLARIAVENYPYAIRAAAGLIYYFAVQTGQIEPVGLAAVQHLDFTDGGVLLQPGFGEQGAADASYWIDTSGGAALVALDLPASASSIATRASSFVSSSGSAFVSDGTDIGPLSADHFVHVAPGASLDITLSGLAAGSHRFEGWWSDVDQTPGVVFQRLEVSTNGGASFSTVSNAIDPGGLNPSPVSFAFAADGVQDVVIRVTENNALDELRLNAIAVPEPGFLWQLGAGLALLGLLRPRRRIRRR